MLKYMHTMMNILREIDIFETPINNKMAILRPLYIKKCHILDSPKESESFKFHRFLLHVSM